MPNAPVSTYEAIGNREDLIDKVTRISPEETVFKSRIGGTTAKAKTHEWLTQALQASNSGNAKNEGAATVIASTNYTVRSRLSNVTQILEKPFAVTYSQEASNPAGIESEFAEQRNLKTLEIMRDINAALINQSSATGASNTARTMHGALVAITSNTQAAGLNEVLNQTLYNKLMHTIWIAGGNPNSTFVHGYNKRAISAWTAPLTRNISAEGRKLVVAIDTYDSDYGKQMIYLEREMPTTQLLIVEEKYWNAAYLRPLDYRLLGEDGGSMRGRVEIELTLEYLAENSSGKITGLSVEA